MVIGVNVHPIFTDPTASTRERVVTAVPARMEDPVLISDRHLGVNVPEERQVTHVKLTPETNVPITLARMDSATTGSEPTIVIAHLDGKVKIAIFVMPLLLGESTIPCSRMTLMWRDKSVFKTTVRPRKETIFATRSATTTFVTLMAMTAEPESTHGRVAMPRREESFAGTCSRMASATRLATLKSVSLTGVIARAPSCSAIPTMTFSAANISEMASATRSATALRVAGTAWIVNHLQKVKPSSRVACTLCSA